MIQSEKEKKNVQEFYRRNQSCLSIEEEVG